MDISESVSPPISPHKARKLSLWLAVLLVILILLAGLAGFYLGSTLKVLETPTKAPIMEATSKSSPATGLAVANSSYNEDPFWVFRIKFPNNYFVSDDSILGRYDSLGGMAPPRMVLTKDKQLFEEEVTGRFNYLDILKNNSECIMIWSTNGFDDATGLKALVYYDDFYNEESKEIPASYREVSKKAIKIGVYDGEFVEIVGGKYPPRYEASLSFPNNKNNTTYFFHTCTKQNKEDFETVLKNFDTKANAHPDLVN